MIIISPKKLSEVLGKPQKTINAWKAPSKLTLIPNENGQIDLGIEKNKIFIIKKLSEIGKTMNDLLSEDIKEMVDIPDTPRKNKPVEKKPKTKPKDKPVKDENVINDKINIYNKYIEEENNLKLELKRVELKKKYRELEKLEGDYVKTSDVISTFKAWNIERDKYLLSQIEKRIRYVCEMESIDIVSTNRYLDGIPEIINECSNNATKELKNKLKKLDV